MNVDHSHLAVGALSNRLENIVRADISRPMAFRLLGQRPFARHALVAPRRTVGSMAKRVTQGVH